MKKAIYQLTIKPLEFTDIRNKKQEFEVTRCIPTVVEYAKNVNADYIMLNEDNLPSWVLNEIIKKDGSYVRALIAKCLLFKVWASTEYDQILFLDNDIQVIGERDIFNENFDIATRHYEKIRQDRATKYFGRPMTPCNTAVMVMNKEYIKKLSKIKFNWEEMLKKCHEYKGKVGERYFSGYLGEFFYMHCLDELKTKPVDLSVDKWTKDYIGYKYNPNFFKDISEYNFIHWVGTEYLK